MGVIVYVLVDLWNWNVHFQKVDKLIKNGADPFKAEGGGNTAICMALQQRNTKMVEILSEIGFPLNHESFKNGTIFLAAARNNRIKIAEFVFLHDEKNWLKTKVKTKSTNIWISQAIEKSILSRINGLDMEEIDNSSYHERYNEKTNGSGPSRCSHNLSSRDR